MKILPLTIATLVFFGGCTAGPPETTYIVAPSVKEVSREAAEKLLVEKELKSQLTADLDSPLRLTEVQMPRYPQYVRRRDAFGDVNVEFEVTPSGAVSNATLVGQPHPFLAALSIESLLRWKFAPLTRGGTPVTARLKFKFVYRLDS